MSFLRPPLPALKSLDTDGRVIYVGSFSKSIFPGLRLGYLVGSRAFIREARALRASVLRHPPGLMQRTAAYFLSLGHYDSLIRRMSRILARRREVMEAALAREGLDIAGRGVFGGSSIWMAAREGVDSTVLAQQLRAQGVLIEPGAPFFHAAQRSRNFYRLAYSSIPEDRIPEGVARLARALRGATGAPLTEPPSYSRSGQSSA
jgi:GntR family transcriptional regulator/MocR family aminotransferase